MNFAESLARWLTLAETALAWIQQNVLTLASLGQAVAAIATFFLAYYAAKPIKAWLEGRDEDVAWQAKARSIASPLILPTLWWLIQLLLLGTANFLEIPSYFLTVTVNLLGAWIIISLLTAPLNNKTLSRFIAIVAWTVAALNIVDVLDDMIIALEQAALPIGDQELTLLSLITGILTLVLLVWLAIAASSLLEQRIAKLSTLNPSARVLFVKLTRIGLIVVAVMVGLSSAGLDLTFFAVFGGAVGLGVGFGLQKVISNLFSGVILLLDRSIKPGDVVEIQGAYGWINKLAARYTSVITRDGTEYLIPNEDMITQPVINWSHSNRLVRRMIEVGVSYDSDIELARQLMVEAATEVRRALDNPAPVCQLKDFGDSAVILELRFWIDDPQNGVSNVASEVRIGIWQRFHENGIVFPFPQQDLHIINAPSLTPTPEDD